MKVSLERWQKGLGMIFSLVKPVKNKGELAKQHFHPKNINKKETHYGKGFTGTAAHKKRIYKRGNTAAGK
jgi:hypothetical protein